MTLGSPDSHAALRLSFLLVNADTAQDATLRANLHTPKMARLRY